MVHQKLKHTIPIERIKKQAILSLEKSKTVIQKQNLRDGKAGQQKGKDAENRFLKAWEIRPVIVRAVIIRPATTHEDHHEKTDAWIEIGGYLPFRIQIKARSVTKGEKRRFRKEGIILLGIPPEDKLEKIQQNTLAEIRIYLQSNGLKILF